LKLCPHSVRNWTRKRVATRHYDVTVLDGEAPGIRAHLVMLPVGALDHKSMTRCGTGICLGPNCLHIRPWARTHTLDAVTAFFIALASTAAADCVDINADPAERLTAITHINAERASQLIAGRPWPSVASLTGIHGIGRGRIRDILEQDLACVGVRAPRGQREIIEGAATVLDADTFQVAGERVRLIGIDAPEGDQLCQADCQDWPCGQVATAAVYEMVGGDPIRCEVYGRDRSGRALAECFRAGQSLNAAIVRAGWALAWYPSTRAVLGPRYEGEEAVAAEADVGIWRGTFVEPWVWRLQ
jgi:endonuclease YncB( thermonuclease family)